MVVFRSVEEALRAGFTLDEKTASGYTAFIQTPAGRARALVELK